MIQLFSVETRIQNADLKLFDDVINGDTYKQWMKKFSAEKARIKHQLAINEGDMKTRIERELHLLPQNTLHQWSFQS